MAERSASASGSVSPKAGDGSHGASENFIVSGDQKPAAREGIEETKKKPRDRPASATQRARRRD